MSYLVDALKKAERERHENRRVDLRTLAESAPVSQGTASARALRWLVGGLVACNVGLLGYLFLPEALSTSGGEGQVSSVSEGSGAKIASVPVPVDTEVMADAADTTPSTAAQGARLPDNAERNAPSPPQAVRQPTVSNRGGANQPSSPTLPPASDPGPSLRLSEQGNTAPRGQVTYSDTPLDDSNEPVATGARGSSSPTPSSTSDGLQADIVINGHLYSTVPGRSFILVNGRRYHEGERLAEGPAVESIDATGATLNYRGDRYHVEGPS